MRIVNKTTACSDQESEVQLLALLQLIEKDEQLIDVTINSVQTCLLEGVLNFLGKFVRAQLLHYVYIDHFLAFVCQLFN